MRVHWNVVVLAALAAATCAFAPSVTRAQNSAAANKSDLLVRVGGPVNVGPADTIGTLWVVGNNVTVSGTVRELVVVNGTARILGTVQDNMVLMNGSADLGPSARIGKDVLLYRSTVVSGAGARIGGTIHNEMGASFGARALWLFWTSLTVAFLVIGLLLGYAAKEPVAEIADHLRSDRGGTLIATVVMVVVLPLAAVLSFVTGIGLILGFFILFVAIPAFSFAGYLIAGTALGRAATGSRPSDVRGIYAAIAIGVTLVQLGAAIPVFGAVIAIIASQLGAGAIVYHLWKRRHPAQSASGLIVQPA